MSLPPVRRNLTLDTSVGAEDSNSGPFKCLSLELLFKIAENGLGLADFFAFATTNKDLFSKLIGRLFEKGMNANKAPLQWACTNHGSGPATIDAIVHLHPQGRKLLSGYFDHDDDANVFGQSPLIVAIRAANFRVVKRLLKYGVDANQPERTSSIKSISYNTRALWSPIHFAVGYSLVPDRLPQPLSSSNSPRLRENIVRHLLRKGAVRVGKYTEAADPCAVMSPLFLHIINGPSNVRSGIICLLLRHGAEATRPSLYRVHWIPETTRMVSPLSLLIDQCRREKHVPDEVMHVVPLLIGAGEGGGRHTTSGAPLIMNCLNPCENMRWVQLTEMLLSSGRQSARAVNTEGEPAVVWLIIRLLDYQLWFQYDDTYATKMEKQNKYDRVRGCTYRMLQLLLHHGADINARCPASHSQYPGATALIIAASIRDELHDVFLDLLECGADAKARDSKGQTASFGLFAGRLSHPNDRIQALSEAGAPMNAADENGDTVLHYAARNSRRHFSNWLPKLLAHGCDLDKRNNQNETFVDVLCKDVRPKQRQAMRKRILEGIQQAKQDAVRVKKQEKNERFRMKVAAAAEQGQKRHDAAKAAQAPAQAGPSTGQTASTVQAGPSTAQAGPSAAQAGPTTARTGPGIAQTGSSTNQAGLGSAQVSGHDNTSQTDLRTTPIGPKILRVTVKDAQIGSGAAQAGPSTAPVAIANQRRRDRGVRCNAVKTTHKPAQAGPSTSWSYARAAKTSLGAAQAGSHTTPAFPGAAPSALATDNKPPGFW